MTEVLMNKKQVSAVAVSLVISLGALYLRFRCLITRDLWNDEVYQLSIVRGAFKPFWQRLTYGDMTCFPGDYLLTHPFVKIFDAYRLEASPETAYLSKWVLAVPHIFMTILGFYLLYLICQKYYRTFAGYVVAFGIVCLNQNLIFHAFEFRPYAVLPTLALAAFYFSEMIICRHDDLSFFKQFLTGVLFIAIIWFHVFGVMIVGCCLLFHLLGELGRRNLKDIWRKHIKFLGTIFIIALPVWIWYATGNPLSISKETCTLFDTFKFFPDPAVNLLAFLKTVFGNLVGEKRIYFLLAGMLFGFALPHRDRYRQILFFFVLIFLPLVVLFLSDLITGYMLLQRQFIWVMPLFAFLLGWQWDSTVGWIIDWRTNRKSKTGT